MVKDLSAAGHAISPVGNHGIDTKFFRHVDGIRLQAPRRNSYKISLFLQPADRFPCTVRIIGSKRCRECSVYIKKKYRSIQPPLLFILWYGKEAFPASRSCVSPAGVPLPALQK